ncbi:Ig-like domain-containing protein [Mycolicibacterium rhodesiae]|uniref:Ig-like domain-containing protein n=1 Tax=Mycolicibacterium rhodesiae TaxID=36814 RepID=UPI0013FE0466|nr:Ig-like domain-containing protein [Mycolicibacterium rhodesiae]MCV7345359.1 cadherin-like domain-containing protein [Mycolicibacterium rhodesiae]
MTPPRLTANRRISWPPRPAPGSVDAPPPPIGAGGTQPPPPDAVVEAVVVGIPLVVTRIANVVATSVAGYLQALANSNPTTPPSLWVLAAYVRREIGDTIESTFFNGTPKAAPIQLAQGPSGVIGTLNVTDPNRDRLSYGLVAQPQHGTVTLNADGTFLYKPNADFGATGGTDTFAVVVSDNTTLHFHLAGGTGATVVPVSVTVAPGGYGTIGVGRAPQAVAASRDGKQVYVTSSEDNTVAVYDVTTRSVITTIEVGDLPSALAVTDSSVYVSSALGGSVAVIDRATNTVAATIAVGDNPTALALNSNKTRLYVANSGDGSVSIIDVASGAVLNTVNVGSAPTALAVAPDGTKVYVAVNGPSTNDGAVAVLNTQTNTVTANYSVGGIPGAVVVTPDGKQLYVATLGAIWALDASTGAATGVVPTVHSFDALTLSGDGTRLYAAAADASTLATIDTRTNKVLDSVAINDLGGALALSGDDTKLYIPNLLGGTVTYLALTPGSQTPAVLDDERTLTLLNVQLYNLTDQPVFVSHIQVASDEGSLHLSGPSLGTTIPVGGSVTVLGYIGQDYSPLGASYFDVGYTLTSQDANFNHLVSIRAEMLGATQRVLPDVSCKIGNCIVDITAVSSSPLTPWGIAAYVLNPSGSSVQVPASNAQQQADILNAYCGESGGPPMSCAFTPTSQIETTTGPHPVGHSVTNNTSSPLTNKIYISDAVAQSDSVTITTKVGWKISEILNAEITAAYGHTWTTTHTFTDELDVTIQPGQTMQVYGTTPIFRVYGDFTVSVGDTTFILKDVYFDSPNPDGSGNYRAEIVPPPVQRTVNRGMSVDITQ